MNDHTGPEHTSSQPPPAPTQIQHQRDILLDISLPTTEVSFAMCNLDDSDSSSDEEYIKPARWIAADHSAMRHKTLLRKY